MTDLSTLIHNADEAAARHRAYLESLADDWVLATCPCCDGAGEWDEGPLPACSGATEPDYRQVFCPECDGTGRAFVPAEPVTLDDIEADEAARNCVEGFEAGTAIQERNAA